MTPKPKRRRQLLQQRDVALALMAEDIVSADDDMRNTQAADQNLGDKILRRALRKVAVEGLDVEVIDAERFDQPRLQPERAEEERVLDRAKKHARMRLKRHDGGGGAFGPGDAHRLPDHRLMAQMQPVEIAERDHAALQRRRHFTPGAEDMHGRCALPRPGCGSRPRRATAP